MSFHGSDAGQATTEYVGTLLASAVVVALVLTAVAVPGARQRVVSSARTAVCEISSGENCGQQPADGDQGAGDQKTSDQKPSDQDDSDQKPGDQDDSDQEAGGSNEAEDPGDWDCNGFLGCAWNVTKQVGSGGYNIGKGAVDDVVGVYDLVTNPGQLVDAGKYIVAHPGEAAKELVWDQESEDMWNREDYGGAVGRTVWNVGSWFIPGVGVVRGASKAGKLGKIGKAADAVADLAKVGRLADDAGALARKAENAAARGDVKGAREAAGASRKKADEAAQDARSKGCPVAAGPRSRSEIGAVVLASGGRGSLGGSVLVRSSPWRAGEDCGVASDAATRADREADAAEQAADTAEKTASSPLVEGGGLAAHETRGGHAIERHVAKTDQELLDRVAAEPGISGASTFVTLEDAERFVSETMTENSDVVQKLATGRLLNRRGRVRQSVEIEKDFQVPVGRSVRSGSTEITEVKKVRVVLEVDSSELGYHIVTAYPVP